MTYINLSFFNDLPNLTLVISNFVDLNNKDTYDYYVYNIATSTNSEVLNSIAKLYDKSSDYTKFLYTVNSTTKKDLSI